VMDRDTRDSTRAAGPLMRPLGAVVVDTSHLSVAEMVAEMKAAVEARR